MLSYVVGDPRESRWRYLFVCMLTYVQHSSESSTPPLGDRGRSPDDHPHDGELVPGASVAHAGVPFELRRVLLWAVRLQPRNGQEERETR